MNFKSFVIICLFSCSYMVAQSGWQFIKSNNGSKPIARHEAAFVSVNHHFFLLGGRGGKKTSVFTTKTNSWYVAAAPPIELHHFQPVVVGHKVYIIGAMTGKYPSETPVPNIYIYDTKKDIWEKGNRIPEDRLRGSTGNVYYNGFIYVACGIKNGHIGDHKNWLDRYDPKTGTWEILTNAPRARDHFQLAVSEGKLYAVAGRQSMAPKKTFTKTISQVDVYDIKTNSWNTLPHNLPTPRAGNAAVAYKKEILVIGGESVDQKSAHAEVEALDIQTKEWRSLDTLQQGRHGTGVFVYYDTLYIASGCGNRGGTPELDTMEKLDMRKN